ADNVKSDQVIARAQDNKEDRREDRQGVEDQYYYISQEDNKEICTGQPPPVPCHQGERPPQGGEGLFILQKKHHWTQGEKKHQSHSHQVRDEAVQFSSGI